MLNVATALEDAREQRYPAGKPWQSANTGGVSATRKINEIPDDSRCLD
jgi:hypothetical protein